MSIKGMTWDQITQKINISWDGEVVSIEMLKKICAKGKLNDRAVQHILEWQLTRHHTAIKVELSKSLIRNQYLSVEAKIATLKFFFFKIGPMKKGDSKKRILAQEVLEICKDKPSYRLEILNLIEEIKLKRVTKLEPSILQPNSQNVVSLESSVLTGISTRDYTGHKVKEEVKQKNDKYLHGVKEVTFADLKDFFTSNENKAKSLITTLQSRLNEPWGADIDSIQWILRNLGPFDSESFVLIPEVVEKFVIEHFKSRKFGNRFTSKPLLKVDGDKLDFDTWRKHYGRSFLLSKRNFVPREFGPIFNTFEEFTRNINPNDLFLRRTYGLRYRISEKQIYSFLYYLKTPDLKRRSSGKFLIVFFFWGNMPVKLKAFLGLQPIREYLNIHSKGSTKVKLNIQNCYVKECKNADEAIETLALLQLEVPFQYLEKSYSTLHIIEEFFLAAELLKRKAFLEFLASKKRAITRIRERKSDIHCINCNQPLTDNLSRVRGYGPDCWRKLKHLSITPLDISSSNDIFERYATRDFGEWVANIEAIAKELTGIAPKTS